MPWYTTQKGKRVWSDTSVPDNELDSFLDEVEPPEPGILSKTYTALTETAEPVRRFMRSVGEKVEAPLTQKEIGSMSTMSRGGYPSQYKGGETPALSGFLGGVVGGTGEIGTENEWQGISRLMNPLDVISQALGMGAAKLGIEATKAGVRGLNVAGKTSKMMKAAKGMDVAARAANLPVMAHGATNLIHADSTPQDRMWGLAELAMGGVGMRSNIPTPTKPTPKKVDFTPTSKQVVTDQGGILKDDFPGVIFTDEYTARVEQPTPEVVKKLLKEGWQPGLGADQIPTMTKPRPQGQVTSPITEPTIPFEQARGPISEPEISVVNRPVEGPRRIGQDNEPLFSEMGQDLPIAPGQLDPRITSLPPELTPDFGPPPETPPLSGEMGPISQGYVRPEITTPNMIDAQRFGNQVVGDTGDDINRTLADLAQRRAAQRADIDAEMVVPKEGELLEPPEGMEKWWRDSGLNDYFEKNITPVPPLIEGEVLPAPWPEGQPATDLDAWADHEAWRQQIIDSGRPDPGPFKQGTTRPPDIDIEPSAAIQNPTTRAWINIVKDLDAKNMPDTSYRAILPTDKQTPLGAGETWRSRIVKEFTDMEIATRQEIANKAAAPVTPNVREQELVRIYNEMQLTSADPNMVAYDTGGRLTPDEIQNMTNSPAMKAMGKVMVDILAKISSLIPEKALLGRLEHVGHLFDDALRGVNIQSPEDPAKFSILINWFAKMAHKSPQQAARGIVHILAHEFTHLGVREEGANFTAFFADVMERFPLEMQYAAQKRIEAIIADSAGRYTPEIQNLLQRYTDSRGRAATSGDVLIRKRGSAGVEAAGPEGIPNSNKPDGGRIAAEKFAKYVKAPLEEQIHAPILRGDLRTTMKSLGKGTRIIKKGDSGVVVQLDNGTNMKIPFKEGMGKQIYNTSRGLIASFDISAPFRQGLPLTGTAAWMKAWAPMFKSLWSEEAYRAIMDNIRNKPHFKTREKLVFDRRTGQRVLRDRPSFAEEVGVRLSDMDSITAKEENLMGGLAEKIPGVRASNRAYTAFLNSLRADTFERMMEYAAKEGLNPTQDTQVAKSIADFVNDATGRGSLKVTIGGREYSAEPAAKIMSNVLFSPRLMASRVRFMNPGNYVFQNKAVRHEYLKSIGRIAVAWTTFASLMKLGGADVSLDPTNSDFGKGKMGNTRIDPAGGIQQYIVAFMRMATGLKTVSTTQESQEMGAGYGLPVRFDTALEFGVNKLHPVAKFAVDAMRASQYKKFNVADRTLSLFLPAVVQDTFEILREDPSLLTALAIPASAVGMGTQTYDIGETQGKIVPSEFDYPFEGGALPGLYPGIFPQ